MKDVGEEINKGITLERKANAVSFTKAINSTFKGAK